MGQRRPILFPWPLEQQELMKVMHRIMKSSPNWLLLSAILSHSLLFTTAQAHPLRQPRFDLEGMNAEAIEFVQNINRENSASFNSILHSSERVQAFVNELKERIVRAPENAIFFRDLEIRVSVIDIMTPNAVALGNGEIFIHRGLILAMPSEEGLLGVLAHEMAHVIRAHLFQQGERLLRNNARPIESSHLGVAVARHAWRFLDGLRLARSSEFEADHLALELMNNARVNPTELPRALQALEASLHGEVSPQRPTLTDRILNSCSTHPLTCLRVDSALREIRTHRYSYASPVGSSFFGRGAGSVIQEARPILQEIIEILRYAR